MVCRCVRRVRPGERGPVPREAGEPQLRAGGRARRVARRRSDSAMYGKVGLGRRSCSTASGPGRTFAIKYWPRGALSADGVRSTATRNLVRSIGADHVIDYARGDFTAGTERYDLVLDNVGNHSMARTRRVLVPGGMLISNGGGHEDGKLGRTIRALLASMVVREQAKPDREDAEPRRPGGSQGPRRGGQGHPGHRSDLSAVAGLDAMAHVATGHARGTVVITMDARAMAAVA